MQNLLKRCLLLAFTFTIVVNLDGYCQTAKVHWKIPSQQREPMLYDRPVWKYQHLVIFRGASQLIAYNTITRKKVWSFEAGSGQRMLDTNMPRYIYEIALFDDKLYFHYVDQIPDKDKYAKQNTLVSLEARTGKILWKKKLQLYDHRIPGTKKPLLIRRDGQLICIDSNNGKTKWKANYETLYGGKPYFKHETVYIVHYEFKKPDKHPQKTYLVALDYQTGKTKWKKLLNKGFAATLMFFQDHLYVYDSNNLYSYDLLGNKRWEIKNKYSNKESLPHLPTKHYLYFLINARHNHGKENLTALNIQSGKKLWTTVLSFRWGFSIGNSAPIEYKNYLLLRNRAFNKKMIVFDH